MPMIQGVHVDRPLTMFSVQYAAELPFLCDKVFGYCPVNKQSDTFFIYDQGDWNRNTAQIRAPGSAPNFGDYDVTQGGAYFCKEREQATLVTDEDIANEDEPLNSEQDGVKWCTRKVMIGNEVGFAGSIITSGVWTGITDKVGTTNFVKWSSPVATPAADVQGWADAINLATNGYRPNTMIIGSDVKTALQNCSDVQDRIKYVTGSLPTAINETLLAQYFSMGRVLVGDMPITTSAKGAATLTNTQLYAGKVWIGYVPPGGVTRPREVSAGKMFAWKNGSIGAGADMRGIAVRRWREESRRGLAIQASAYLDWKVTAANAGGYASSAI